METITIDGVTYEIIAKLHTWEEYKQAMQQRKNTGYYLVLHTADGIYLCRRVSSTTEQGMVEHE